MRPYPEGQTMAPFFFISYSNKCQMITPKTA